MKIQTIRTYPELERVRSAWELWQNHPNNDFAQFEMICRLRPEVESPCILVVEQNGRPQSLLIGRLERTQVTPQVGYYKVASIPARVIVILHQGWLGRADGETAKALVLHLWSMIASGEADAVSFHNLAEHSPLLAALGDHGPRWWCDKRPVWFLHWQTGLTGEPGFLLKKMKPKHRALLRKEERNLEAAFPGRVRWSWLRPAADQVPFLCARLEEVAVQTYQRGLASGFRNDEEHRSRLALYADRGLLRAQLLEIDGRIRAFDIGFVYQDTFFGSETAFDPDLKEYAPGTLVMLRMADELMREGVARIDWGLGDAHYKRQLGDVSWRESTLWLFSPTAKGLLLRSMLGLSVIVNSTARKMLQQVKLMDKLKTSWRRRLTKGEKNS